jgi:hypothetical protein
MPPKALFDNSHRPDKLVVPACSVCNRGTSTADLALSIVSRWHYHTYLQCHEDHTKLIHQARIQAPELVKEWQGAGAVGIETARNHLRRFGVNVPRDAGIATYGPLTIRQLNLFAHKATLAAYFESFKEPLPLSGGVLAFWRSKEDFALAGVPSELLEMFPEYRSLFQGNWDTKQIFEYRFNLNRGEGLFGLVAKFRDGIFTIGFAVSDLSSGVSGADEWVRPSDPETVINSPRYQRKN